MKGRIDCSRCASSSSDYRPFAVRALGFQWSRTICGEDLHSGEAHPSVRAYYVPADYLIKHPNARTLTLVWPSAGRRRPGLPLSGREI